MTEEHAVQGWARMAEMVGISERKLISYKDEMRHAGVIFYVLRGHPPAKRMMFFPSLVKRWLGEMSKNGKIL